jgi:ABC-type transporter Mla subunit MlaD
MTRRPLGDDDKTPARSRTAETMANIAVALATAAQQLKHAAELLKQAAERAARDALTVDDLDATARAALLEDLEDELGAHAEALHMSRREVRALRLPPTKGPPP